MRTQMGDLSFGDYSSINKQLFKVNENDDEESKFDSPRGPFSKIQNREVVPKNQTFSDMILDEEFRGNEQQ